MQVVQQIYAAFSRGDVPAVMEHISDDLRHFGIVSELQLVPWHIPITKKKDVPRFVGALAEAAEFTRFEPRDLATGGDDVYCTISLDARYKHNGKRITQDSVMHHFTFRNGKVVEWHGPRTRPRSEPRSTDRTRATTRHRSQVSGPHPAVTARLDATSRGAGSRGRAGRSP